ncbi:hypothetical protein BGZ94_005023, partial [Podila epigama]
MEGAIQPKNVINDVFLSSTMLCDDVELYLNESSSSSFDSDSDSGFSTPSTHDDDSHCFSTPMTPMSPFLENDADDDQLYSHDDDELQLQPSSSSSDNHVHNSLQASSSSTEATEMVVDMKRPMFIPVSICDPRDFAAAASLPTPPECNARKHSYDFLRNSDAFMLGGISSSKRRRMLSVDMMSSTSDAPASPPASNAGDDDCADLSDADSSASSYMARRRSLFQMRNVRHLTPTSPSMPEIGLDHVSYQSEDNYSSSDDDADFGYPSEDHMHIHDAMSSSDESDSDLSDVEEYQFPV